MACSWLNAGGGASGSEAKNALMSFASLSLCAEDCARKRESSAVQQSRGRQTEIRATLEHQAHGQLGLLQIARAENAAEVSGVRRSRRTTGQIGCGEKIEHLTLGLDPQSFTDVEGAGQNHVEAVETAAVDLRCRNGSQRCCQAGTVSIHRGEDVVTIPLIAGKTWHVLIDSVDQRGGHRVKRQRRTRLPDRSEVDFPGKLDRTAGDQNMPAIDVRRAPVEVVIVLIYHLRLRIIIPRGGKRLRRQDLVSFCEPFL